jgi:hypothetical protein
VFDDASHDRRHLRLELKGIRHEGRAYEAKFDEDANRGLYDNHPSPEA